MNVRSAIDARAGSLMVLLCMTWGFHQIAIKAAAPDVSPILQIAIRSGIAAVLAGSLALWRREAFLAHGIWKPGLAVAALFGIEFLLIGESLRFTTASRTVVFLYTAPIFAALGLHWRLRTERLNVVQWLGIALAFGGIALAFFRSDADLTAGVGTVLWGDALALLSGLAWGATTVVIRNSRLTDAPATITLTYQLVGAFVLLSVAAVCMGQTRFEQTTLAWSSILFQAIVVSFASYLAWFWLLRFYLASRLGALSFLTPLFGVAFGVWLLKEPLETNFVIGASMVLGGIGLVSGHESLAELFRSSRPQEEG